MSTKKHVISVRTNTSFSVDYESDRLSPQVELILLFQEPKYGAKKTKDGKHFEIVKDHELGEARFMVSIESLSRLISELQVTQAGLAKYDNLAGAINLIIEKSKDQVKDKTTA